MKSESYIPSAAMAVTERSLLLGVEAASLEDLELRRRAPKNWESEDEVRDDDGRRRAPPRKPAGERALGEGLL